MRVSSGRRANDASAALPNCAETGWMRMRLSWDSSQLMHRDRASAGERCGRGGSWRAVRQLSSTCARASHSSSSVSVIGRGIPNRGVRRRRAPRTWRRGTRLQDSNSAARLSILAKARRTAARSCSHHMGSPGGQSMSSSAGGCGRVRARRATTRLWPRTVRGLLVLHQGVEHLWDGVGFDMACDGGWLVTCGDFSRSAMGAGKSAFA